EAALHPGRRQRLPRGHAGPVGGEAGEADRRSRAAPLGRREGPRERGEGVLPLGGAAALLGPLRKARRQEVVPAARQGGPLLFFLFPVYCSSRYRSSVRTMTPVPPAGR